VNDFAIKSERWGAGEYGESIAPTIPFEQISASGDTTCGLKTDGYIACWGGTTRNLTLADFE
jgi:hypothetical protein